MTRIYPIIVFISLLGLFSCSTTDYQLENSESSLIFYVEEFNQPVSKPRVDLNIEGLESPLRLKLKAPAAIVSVSPAEVLHATGWTAAKGVTISGPGNFDIEAPAGRFSLVPYKIQISSKSQLTVVPLNALDLEYARSQFSKNEDLAGLDIKYPEILPE